MNVHVIEQSMCSVTGKYKTRLVTEIHWDLLQTQYQNKFGTYYIRNTKISLGLIYEDQSGTYYRRNTKISLGLVTDAIRR